MPWLWPSRLVVSARAVVPRRRRSCLVSDTARLTTSRVETSRSCSRTCVMVVKRSCIVHDRGCRRPGGLAAAGCQAKTSGMSGCEGSGRGGSRIKRLWPARRTGRCGSAGPAGRVDEALSVLVTSPVNQECFHARWARQRSPEDVLQHFVQNAPWRYSSERRAGMWRSLTAPHRASQTLDAQIVTCPRPRTLSSECRTPRKPSSSKAFRVGVDGLEPASSL